MEQSPKLSLAALPVALGAEEQPGNQHGRRNTVAWRRIYGVLRNAIGIGFYVAGDRLPIEADLAEHFGVNRHTVRRALGELTRDGLIQQAQGRGTFVTFGQRLEMTLGAEPLLSSRYGLRMQQLERRMVEAGERLSVLLGIQARQAVVGLQLLLLHHDHPIGLADLSFAQARFSQVGDVLRREGTLEQAMAGYAVGPDLLAGPSSLIGRAATTHELGLLKSPQERTLLVVDQCVFTGPSTKGPAMAVYAATVALRGDAVRLLPG